MNREIVPGGVYPIQGDVESTAGSSVVTVVGLEGIPMPPAFPSGGEVLTYDGSSNTLLLEQPVQQIELETNGTANSTQTLLNIVAGTNVTITNVAGTTTINSTGGGSGGSGFTTKSIVTGSRSFGTVFTNSSGATMFVIAIGQNTGSSGDYKLEGFTGGSIDAADTGTSTIAGATVAVSFMVLAGETYEVVITALSGSPTVLLNTWTEWTGTGGSGANFADAEVPGGLINSSNVTFTLAHSPSPALSLNLFLNGIWQAQGASHDYTLTGSTITMTTAPSTSSMLYASYRF
jgi:hypothetical protein